MSKVKKTSLSNDNIVKSSSNTTLVIVESPAKCNKIESYLGPGYKCIATFGHFRTLDGLKSINMDNFKIQFSCMDEKTKQISRIKSEIEQCGGNVIIAIPHLEGYGHFRVQLSETDAKMLVGAVITILKENEEKKN